MPTFDTRWKQDILAAIVLLISVLCCFHRLVFLPSGIVVGPQNGGRNDLTASILPSRGVLRNAIQRDGEWPLWHPYELTGIPWWGNPQSAMLYPPNWLFILTAHVALASWLMAAHLWWGGIGVYCYCRKLELNWAAGVVAGCGYLGAPFLIANVCEGHYNPVCIAGWLPWALICFERLRRGERGGTILLPIVLSLCFFAGHVQELFYLVLILSCWLVAACIRPRLEGGPSRQTLLKNWCLVGLATIGLTSLELIPIYAYTKQAVRSSGLSVEASARFSLNETSFWQLLDPLIVHGPEIPTISGRFYWETVCHFGLALTLLAIVGIVASWNRYGQKRIFVTLVCCTLFGLGTATPFFPLLFQIVPGVSFFRGSSRILMHLSLWVSLLAGYGVHALLTRSREQCSRCVSYSIGAIAALASLLLLLFVGNPAGWIFQPPDADSLRVFNPWTISFGAGGFLVMCFFARVRWPYCGAIAAVLAFFIVTAENSIHAHRVLRVVPAEQFRGDSEIVQFLKSNASGTRVFATQELLSDWEAWQHQISKLHGYEPVPPVRVAILFAAILQDDSPTHLFVINPTHSSKYRQNMLNLTGVRFAVIPAGGPRLSKEWKMVAQGEVPPAVALEEGIAHREYEIWENTTVLPRAFVLGQTRIAPERKRLSDQLSEVIPQKEVLVSQDVLSPGPHQIFQPVQVLHASENHVTIEASLDAPGYLVLTDLFAPGWKATVEGAGQPMIPVNVIFRGVPLTEGTHRIEFSYTPPGLWFGGIVSALTLLALLGTTVSSMLTCDEKPSNSPS